MTEPFVPGQLIVKGRVLSRTGEPKFRRGVFEFLSVNYDTTTETQRVPEKIEFELDDTGYFRVTLSPSTNGDAWVGRLLLVDFHGQAYLDKRVAPASGEVDWFQLARATDMEDVYWPEHQTPILVSDFNKPGGPLQLTDLGTIPVAAMPPEFLRVDDERLPDLELWNYVTRQQYEQDQATIREFSFESSMYWEAAYDTVYRPSVTTVQSDGTVLMGAVSYPVGTKTVRVDWDAPTSGTLILR